MVSEKPNFKESRKKLNLFFMKKIVSKIVLITIFATTLIGCEEEATLNELTTETNVNLENGITSRDAQTDFDRFNETISAGVELVYELSTDYIEEVSHNFEEEFMSIEKMSVVMYNDIPLFEITGQNLDGVPTVQYNPMDEIVGEGTDVSLSGPRTRPCQCSGRTKIYYYYQRPDGTFYLSHTKCFACPSGLLAALGWV